MREQLSDKVSDHYFKHDQWLNLTSQYVDEGKLYDQTVCLIDEKKNKCIFCVTIQTYSNLDSGWEHAPYLLYNPEYNEFMMTVHKFGYLTKEDINKAIRFLIRNELWLCFNIKIDGVHI